MGLAQFVLGNFQCVNPVRALAHQLNQLEDQGHDVQLLLYAVPEFVDRAHTPAAFAFRSIEDRLDDLLAPGSEQARDMPGPDPARLTDAEVEAELAQMPEINALRASW